jgi:adenylosuccinate synthase
MALFPLICLPFLVPAPTVADGKAKCVIPFAGEIVAVDGYITTLGSGAGTSTDFQISCGAVDYLATKGAFEVNSATNLLESQVLAVNPTFAAGATLEIDCDAISTSPANALLRVWVKMAPVDGY